MLPIIAIRPEPGLAKTIAAACAAGVAVTGEPLFEIRPVAWDPPPAERFDALLVGSGNALRHAGADLARYRRLPVHAVGAETAGIARAAGFIVARTGEGGLQALLDEAAGDAPARFLRLAGRERVPLTPPGGSTIATSIVYEAAALPLPERLAASLRGGAVVLLHSGVAARHFAGECARLGLDREVVALAALAPRIAAAAGGKGAGWRAVRSAERAEDAALLALARDMCH